MPLYILSYQYYRWCQGEIRMYNTLETFHFAKNMNAKMNQLGNCRYITESITYFLKSYKSYRKTAKDSIMQSFKFKFILFIIHYTGSNVLSVLAPCEKITKVESFLCQGYSKMHITRNYN